MAIVKKTYKRRRTVRARRMNISRPKSSYMTRNARATLSVNRTKYDGAWTFSTATTAGFWRYQSFTAGTHIQAFSELASVFDEYKIYAIKQTWRPRYDNVQAPTAAGTVAQPQAYAHIALDPDSITAPTGVYSTTNLNSFLENGKVRTKTLNKPFSVYFKPRCDTNVLGGLKRENAGWFKTSDTTIPHYGYHMFIQQNNMDSTNTNIVLDGFVTVYAKFRNLK